MTGRVVIERARVNDLSAVLNRGAELLEIETRERGHRAVEVGSASVHLGQPAKERRERTEPREQRVDERGLVGDLQQRVARPFATDGRGAIRAAGRGTERPRAVRRIHRQAVGQGQDPVPQRMELRVRELLGMLGPEQVSASHRARHQRPTAEQCQPRAVRGFEQIGEMVRRVARRRDRLEHERPDRDALAVAESMVRHDQSAGRGREEAGSARDQLGAARHEVSMRMRVGRVRDAQPACLLLRLFELGDAARIDRERGAITEIDQIRRMADAFIDEPDNRRSRGPAHRGLLAATTM